MGFITQAEYAKIYESIKKSTTSSSTPSVLIFVALNVDAICACKMLTTLMKSDFIPFQVQPVAGYTDLFSANDRLVQNNYDVKTIIFLNLGALTSILPIFYPPTSPDELHSEPRPDLNFYVIDSHRPWDLNNVFLKEGGVYCVDDGDIENTLSAEGGIGEDYETLLEGDPAYDEAETTIPVRQTDGDEDDEYEATANENGKRGRSRSRSRSRSNSGSDNDDPLTENEASDDDEDGQPGIKPSSRHRTTTPDFPRLSSTVPPASPRKSQLQSRYKQAQERIAAYQSQGTTKGRSISSLVYAILSSLGREDNDSLWLGIIGWSSLPNYRSSPEHLLWRDEIRRLNPPPLSQTTNSTASVNDHSIRLVEDFPFPLLRHWSLYHSMLHSPYLCLRLRLYASKGRSRLDHLLAKMGVSQEHARQTWTHTPRDLKTSLKEKLEKVEGGLSLELVRGKSFERAWGFKGVWAASDVVQVIESTLVSVEERDKENITPRGEGKDDISPAERFRQREGEMKLEWVKRFWKALDSIDRVEMLSVSLPSAKQFHKVILSTGQSIIEKRAIKSLRSFRIAIIREGPDLAFFEHPLALTKLATWLCEVSAEEDRGRARRVQGDLVLACLIPSRSVFLVVGVNAKESDENNGNEATEAVGNKFGLAFGRVAKRDVRGLGMKIDAFEPGIVEVREADLGRFLEVLTDEFVRH